MGMGDERNGNRKKFKSVENKKECNLQLNPARELKSKKTYWNRIGWIYQKMQISPFNEKWKTLLSFGNKSKKEILKSSK